MSLQIGDLAPEFSLPATGGGELSLGQAVDCNAYVVLAFYPKDNTSG